MMKHVSRNWQRQARSPSRMAKGKSVQIRSEHMTTLNALLEPRYCTTRNPCIFCGLGSVHLGDIASILHSSLYMFLKKMHNFSADTFDEALTGRVGIRTMCLFCSCVA